MTKKEFFKGLATVLLMPGGLLAAAVAGVLLGILLAAAISGALLFGAARWVVRSIRTLIFGKRGGPAGQSCSSPRERAALPEEISSRGLPVRTQNPGEPATWTDADLNARDFPRWLQ